jgi:hypothetical protein
MAVKVKINLKGLFALMNDPGVIADLERRAHAIADAANIASESPRGHFVVSDTGKKRARAAVVTGTKKAMRKEAVHATLTKSIDAGRR